MNTIRVDFGVCCNYDVFYVEDNGRMYYKLDLNSCKPAGMDVFINASGTIIGHSVTD